MNKLELVSKLRADAKGTALEAVCSRAAQVLESAGEAKIVVGEDRLPVSQIVKIAERRLSRLSDLGEQVAGLGESLMRITMMTGNLRAAYAETGDTMIQFWLGDGDVLVGCVIGTKSTG